MKSVWICACALLLVTAAGFAQEPGQAPLSIEAFTASLARSVDGSDCAPRASQVVFASEGLDSICSATAFCESGTVYCEGNSTCSAVDRDCSTLERGHVTCDGVTTSCPTGCCTTGTIIERACCRCTATGSCFDCCRCEGGTLFQCSEACNP